MACSSQDLASAYGDVEGFEKTRFGFALGVSDLGVRTGPFRFLTFALCFLPSCVRKEFAFEPIQLRFVETRPSFIHLSQGLGQRA